MEQKRRSTADCKVPRELRHSVADRKRKMALQLYKKRPRGHSKMPSDVMPNEDHLRRSQLDVFSHMNTVMSRFDTMMNDMFSTALSPFSSTSSRKAQGHSGHPFSFGFCDDDLAADSNCHMYSTSAVMSMAVGPDGRPQVYQASTSTKALPGGIRETQKTVCDSRSGVKKMSLGHHIGQRGRVIERQKNLFSGEEEERQEFINLDEEEAGCFDKEFERRIMNGKHAIPAASAVRISRNKPKRSTTLTPEVLPLSGQRSNNVTSHVTERLSSGKANKGLIKGSLRKVNK